MQQVFWSLDEVIELIVGCVLVDDSIIKIQVIIEAKHVHRTIVDLIGLLGVLLIHLFEFLVQSPLLMVILLGMTVFVPKAFEAVTRVAILEILILIVEKLLSLMSQVALFI